MERKKFSWGNFYKKGSHVGMMISFVIFVTFLVFLYSILQPVIKIRQNKELVLDSLKTELVNMLDSPTSVTEINELADRYNTDYEGLKTELKIPAGSEFGFSFINNEGITEVTAEKDIPTHVSVYAKKVIVYYAEGEDVLLGFINIKVW